MDDRVYILSVVSSVVDRSPFEIVAEEFHRRSEEAIRNFLGPICEIGEWISTRNDRHRARKSIGISYIFRALIAHLYEFPFAIPLDFEEKQTHIDLLKCLV